MKSLKILSLICVILCIVFLVCGKFFLEYGNSYTSNPKYKSRIIGGGGGGMAYIISVESNNQVYLQYERDNATPAEVISLLRRHQAQINYNSYQRIYSSPKIDYYGEFESDDMLDITDPSELIKIISNKPSLTFTIRVTNYNNIDEIEKVKIVAHKYNSPITREDIDLNVVHAVESPYIVKDGLKMIVGLIAAIIAPIFLIVAIILHIRFLKMKLQSAE